MMYPYNCNIKFINHQYELNQLKMMILFKYQPFIISIIIINIQNTLNLAYCANWESFQNLSIHPLNISRIAKVTNNDLICIESTLLIKNICEPCSWCVWMSSFLVHCSIAKCNQQIRQKRIKLQLYGIVVWIWLWLWLQMMMKMKVWRCIK